MVALASVEISQDFGLERLRALLQSRNVELRHDVDYVPHCAVQMARLERELGVRSTFYVRPLDCYPDPEEARLSFLEVGKLGHDLGVHVDLLLGRKAEVPDGYMRFCSEADLLSLSADLPVTRRISFHAPPAKALWREVEGFEHAMSASWSGRYIADSRGSFSRTPETFLQTARPLRPIQLNLHPCWWFLSPYDREVLRQRELKAP